MYFNDKNLIMATYLYPHYKNTFFEQYNNSSAEKFLKCGELKKYTLKRVKWHQSHYQDLKSCHLMTQSDSKNED